MRCYPSSSRVICLLLAVVVMSSSPTAIQAADFLTPPVLDEVRRVPAEWEPQQAAWMQWPKGGESYYRANFSRIIDALQAYQPINIIVNSVSARNQAQNYLTGDGVPLSNITWHIMPYDAAWLRDNGPVWVEVNSQLTIQDWGFDAWGEQYPPWEDDDAVPCRIATLEGVTCEDHNTLICEKGNLEFNGAGALIVNWGCQSSRNPGMSQAEMEAIFMQSFGLDQVVWLPSEPSGDLTGGHTDGIARFIDADTVAVARYVDQGDPDAWVYEEAATIIGNAGFEVVRIDVPGYVSYYGNQLPAIYVNWLVANGVVVMTGFGQPAWDNAAQATVEGFFPGRDVILVETLDLWDAGGGVHCVTNDQPVGPTAGITLSAGFDCLPSSGTVPFSTTMQVTLNNLYNGQIRRLAARLNVLLANGASFPSWRSGYTNVNPAGSYTSGWSTIIPALATVIGDNTFTLVAEDVTPAPYNLPPYPPSADTATAACTVTGIAP